jgi:hypothetical protein
MLKLTCFALVVLGCLGAATADYCPDNWFRAGDLCYQRASGSGGGSYSGNYNGNSNYGNYENSQQANKWYWAKKDCEKKGSTLITGITTQEVFNQLKHANNEQFDGTFWTGLRTILNGPYHWIDEVGTVNPLSSWFKSSLTASTGCTVYDSSTGLLDVVSCENKNYWYCQRPLITSNNYNSYESNSYSGNSYNGGNNYNGNNYNGNNYNSYESSSYTSNYQKPSSYNAQPYQSTYNSESYQKPYSTYDSNSYNQYKPSEAYNNKPYQASTYNSGSTYNKPSKSYSESKSSYNSEYAKPSTYNSEYAKPSYNSEYSKPSSYNSEYAQPSYNQQNYNSQPYNGGSYNSNGGSRYNSYSN